MATSVKPCTVKASSVLGLMRAVRNSFYKGGVLAGEIEVVNGYCSLTRMFDNANYIIFIGDIELEMYKVYKYKGKIKLNKKITKTFKKAYPLYVPEDFIALASKIEKYTENQPALGLASERFGDYSYTAAKADNSGYESVFRDSLNKYRKMFDEIFT